MSKATLLYTTFRVEWTKQTCKCLVWLCMLTVILYVQRENQLNQITCPLQNFQGRRDVTYMDANDLSKYFSWTSQPSCKIIHDFSGMVNSFKPKMESEFVSQKMLCMDAGLMPKANNCLVYAFGDSHEWTFDTSLDKLGCQIFAFDPQLEQDEYTLKPKVHFMKLAIGDEDTNNDTITGWKLRTLQSVYDTLKPIHGKMAIDFMKVNVQQLELLALPHIIRSGMLDKVKQLGVEIHFHEGAPILQYLRIYLNMLKVLEYHGMIRYATRVVYYKSATERDKIRDTIFEIFYYNVRFR